MAVRIASFIQTEHDSEVKNRYFWTDSQIVSKWLKKDPIEFKIFVANRLKEIRECTDYSEWYWVDSKNNPADDASRYVPSALDNDSRWFNGPYFLYLPQESWPLSYPETHVDSSDDIIEKVTLFSSSEESSFINFDHFRSWTHVISVITSFSRL